MIRVAWLTCARWREGPVADGALPAPDATDFALVAPLAARRGIAFDIVRWDAPDLVERGYAAAVVRSTWDYAQRADAFVARLAELEAAGVAVFNSSAVVRWNARKTYLEDLAQRGAPTIPTVWADSATPEAVLRAFDTFEAAEIVVKPQFGAGSRDTIRLKRSTWAASDLIAAPSGPAMLQPFLPAIETSGESSLFYFGGKPAHTIRKTPASGRWYANVDGAKFERGEARADEREAAETVLSLAPPGMLYARVDLVEGADGRPRLIELEAIEPYLFLTFAPEGAGVFVDALRAALDGNPVLSR
jgi:glutathione synthase/RimK-type ligase-like ATP-grasp enzyme